jgi:hypothetical protein
MYSRIVFQSVKREAALHPDSIRGDSPLPVSPILTAEINVHAALDRGGRCRDYASLLRHSRFRSSQSTQVSKPAARLPRSETLNSLA